MPINKHVLFCDECLKPAFRSEPKFVGFGCLIASVLSILASVGIVVGVLDTIVGGGIFEILSKHKIYGFIVVALLGMGVFGLYVSYKFMTEGYGNDSQEEEASTE